MKLFNKQKSLADLNSDLNMNKVAKRESASARFNLNVFKFNSPV